MDHLVYILVKKVVEYYSTKGRRQINGFEGPNLYFQKRLTVIKKSRSVEVKNITVQYHIYFSVVN